MNNTLATVNKFLVDVFNDILKIEEEAIKNSLFNDVSVTEVHTIEAIGMYVPKSMTEIAKKLCITVGTLTVAINNLVKKGYVKKNKCEYDKRIVMVSLTKKGKLLFRFHQKFHSDMVKAAILGLSEYEADIFTQALTNLNNYLTEKHNKTKQGEAYV